MSVHKVFENFCRRTTKRIKVFSAIFAHVHRHPMFSGSVMWVGVADDQSSHRLGEGVAAVDAAKRVDGLRQNAIDFDVVHDEKS